METPYKRAWTEYSRSDELREATDPTTLGSDNKVRRTLLENRLRNAFDAGWNGRAYFDAYGKLPSEGKR